MFWAFDGSIGCDARKPKDDNEKRINTKIEWRFSRSGTQTLKSCHRLGYARGSESIIFFNYLCNPLEIYNYARIKHPFTSYPTAKHPKRSKFPITNMREKPVGFFIEWHEFSAHNNFDTLGSFEKVFFAVEAIIP